MNTKADPDKLRQSAWQLERLAEQLHENMESIAVTVMQTQDCWQGRAQAAYGAKVLQMQGEYEKFIALLQKIALVLQEAGDAYEDMDRVQTGKIETV